MWIHHLDNQMCAADNNDPTTALDGANIKIHKGEGQATCKECEWSELGSRSTAISGASKENPRFSDSTATTQVPRWLRITVNKGFASTSFSTSKKGWSDTGPPFCILGYLSARIDFGQTTGPFSYKSRRRNLLSAAEKCHKLSFLRN